MKKVALGISAIYHPLLLTTVLIATMIWLAPNTVGRFSDEGKWQLTGVFAVMTFALPMVIILILRFTANISSMLMDERSDRISPLLVTSVLYSATTYWVAFKFQMSTPMVSLMLAVTITVVLIAFITLFWKISAHSAAAWGGAGIFMAFLQKTIEIQLLWALIIAVMMAGIVSSARLYLRTHNLSQILAGGCLGFIVCYLCVYLMI